MPFTAEELEAMRRADEEIEAEFSGLTLEEYHASQARDRQHHLEALDNKERKIAEAQRTYYQANREKIAEAQRTYYQANREKIAEAQRTYREANREKIAEAQRTYYQANREKIAEAKRTYYQANREKIAEAQRTYYQANREKIAEAKKGRILYDLRHEHGMSQRRLAKALGVSQPTISQWETGAVPFDLEAVQAYFRGLPTEHEEAAGVRATRRRPGKEKRYDATGESISQRARPFQGEGRETVEP